MVNVPSVPKLAAVAGAAVAARALARRARAAEFAGRVAFVTGGSRGLGFAIARELGRQGARVAICARGAEALERARARLAGDGVDVTAVVCDVSDRTQVERALAEVQERVGEIEILVNNAGVISVGPLEAMTLGDFEESMAIHYWGTVYPTLALLPAMRARRRGWIANVTSIGGKISVPQLVSYNPSKFAAVGFSEGLRAEVAEDGISVLTVVPGLMRTGSYVAAFYKGDARLEYTLFAPIAASPLNTIEPERAARRIVAALRRGDAELTLTLHAKLLARANGLAPGLTANALALANRLLPDAAGPTGRTRGDHVASPVDESFVTAAGRRAQRRYNQPPDDQL